MRDAHIERLLGGYATNTLTDAERQVLFDAALNDQELFNALQDEEALRDLLADADSRQAISRALQQPAVQPAKPWFAQRWMWAMAGTAAATCALLLMVRLSKPQYQRPAIVAELQNPSPASVPAGIVAQAPAPAPAAKSMKRRALAPAATAASKDFTAPPASPVQNQELQVSQVRAADQSVEVQASAAQVQAQSGAPGQAQTPVPQLARSTAFRAGPADLYMKAEIAAIPYAVWKRGADGQFAPVTPSELLHSGDVVRVVVRPPLSGSLSISEDSPKGLQLRLSVIAGQEYTVPDSPIQVMGDRQWRLVLTTPSPARTVVTNITLGPGKASNGR